MQFIKNSGHTIIRIIRRTGYRFKGSRVQGYFCKRTEIGSKVTTHPTSHLLRAIIGNSCRIGKDCVVSESSVGDYTIISQGALVNISNIGKFCGISHYCRIGAEEHPIERVTTHLITYWPDYGFISEPDKAVHERRRAKPTIIGNDVFLGHGVIVMPGVVIGNGAIIGAGSVVTKNVAPYSIVAGVPAKIIKMRFDQDIIECLERIQWWDWSAELIKSRIQDFNDTRNFCQKYINK